MADRRGSEHGRPVPCRGLIDELHLHIAPLVLTRGERLFDGVPPLDLEPVQVVGSPRVTHVKYRVRTAG